MQLKQKKAEEEGSVVNLDHLIKKETELVIQDKPTSANTPVKRPVISH